MNNERLHPGLLQSVHDHIGIVYGEGVEDTFVSKEDKEMNIEGALWQMLRDSGYQRIVFIAPHRPLYFLDGESRKLAQPGVIDDTKRRGEIREHMNYLEGGPLQGRFVLKIPRQDTHGKDLYSEMGDVHALRTLDAIMQDENVRSAVVMMQSESTLGYFEDARLLSGVMGEWMRLGVRNENVCMLVYAVGGYSALYEAVEQVKVPEVRLLVHKRSGLLYVGSPEKAELIRVIELLRHEGAQVKIDEIEKLASWMAAEGGRMREWMVHLRSSGGISVEESRKGCWFSAQLCREKEALDVLGEMVGLEQIKTRLREMAAWLQVRRGETGIILTSHMIFSGNPGTGKTTVARLVGELYHELGLLKRGQLVEVSGRDLVAEYVGGTAVKTNAVIDKALDGVLFIDEAYTLTEEGRGGYGQEAVDTLVKRMEDERGRLVVIAAGYPGRMARFRRSNPGLSRRFAEENVLDFSDYCPEELWQILKGQLTERGIRYTEVMEILLKEVIDGLYHKRDEGFGNAGEMRNLAEGLERRRALRLVEQKLEHDVGLEKGDIPEKYCCYLKVEAPRMATIFEEMDELVGLEEVKTYLRRLVRKVQYDREVKGEQAICLQHLIFSGNPGTGKTSVARMLGRIYRSLGLLSKGHCVEVSRAELVAGFVGQTAAKTLEKVKEAIGGVLFIDEAYSLLRGGEHDFGREVLDVMVKAMENYAGRLVIVAAGYPVEMRRLLVANPGLASRFGVVVFRDYRAEELVGILQRQVEIEGFILPIEVLNKLLEVLQGEAGIPWRQGNGRGVLDFYNQMKGALAERVMLALEGERGDRTDNDALRTFKIEDLPTYMPAEGLSKAIRLPAQVEK